jgi:hypothetical protein
MQGDLGRAVRHAQGDGHVLDREPQLDQSHRGGVASTQATDHAADQLSQLGQLGERPGPSLG